MLILHTNRAFVYLFILTAVYNETHKRNPEAIFMLPVSQTGATFYVTLADNSSKRKVALVSILSVCGPKSKHHECLSATTLEEH